MTIPEMQRTIRVELERLHAVARECFPKANLPVHIPAFELALSGRCAGRAWLTQWKLQFNPVLFHENQEKFITDTVGHEYAHLVAWLVFKDAGHGPDFYWTCGRLNVETRRCHSYSTANVSATAKRHIELSQYE